MKSMGFGYSKATENLSNTKSRIIRMANSTLLCLATLKGLGALDALNEIPDRSRYFVCTFKEIKTAGNTHQEIIEKGENLGCQIVDWKDVRENPNAFAKRENLDAVIAIGWRYLLPVDISQVTRYGVIVFHDSLLPRHRGFAPLATAILCGDQRTGLTVLHAADEVDAGDIILQKEMALKPIDTIADAIERVTPLYREALVEVLSLIRNGEPLSRHAQDHSAATYSIWRGPEDGAIDWEHDCAFIDRLIRSAGYPYSGAYTSFEGNKIIIREALPVDDMVFSVRQPGKVWRLTSNGPIVVCGKGLLQIRSAEHEDGTPHLPLKRMRIRYGT